MFCEPQADASPGMEVTTLHNLNLGRPEKPLEWDVRVVGLDQAGKEHFPEAGDDNSQLGNSTETHAFVRTTYTFRDLPPAQAKEFLLQVRPFQSQKFSQVVLEPKSAAPVAKP